MNSTNTTIYDVKSLEMGNGKHLLLKHRIIDVLISAVGQESAAEILMHRDNATDQLAIEDMVEHVERNSHWNEGHYTDSDIRSAIGHVITARIINNGICR